MSSVQVAEEGNRRKGTMNAAEVEQCVHDIVAWFQRKGDLEVEGMKAKDIQSIEKALDTQLPEELCILLEKQNGGLWFNEYKSLSSADLISKGNIKWPHWKREYIPFAADLDDALLIIDGTDEGAIYECDDTGKGKVLADSFSEYLEKFRDQLLAGKFEFIQDVGLVETARK